MKGLEWAAALDSTTVYSLVERLGAKKVVKWAISKVGRMEKSMVAVKVDYLAAYSAG